MPTATRVPDAHTAPKYRCLDRMFLNTYVRQLERPPLMRRFLEIAGTPNRLAPLFEQHTKQFVRAPHRYAVVRGLNCPGFC